MEDYNTSNNIGEAVMHKIKLFTKESYFNYFRHILIQKSKNFSAFEKISSLSFSIEKLIKEKSKNKLKKKEVPKRPKSPWNLIMLLVCNIPSRKKLEYSQNEFNLNPICYMYLTLLCQKKLKLLITFSNANNLTLDTVVKYYLDLCINHINLKEFDNKLKKDDSEKNMIDYKKINQKNKKQVNSKNNLYEKKNTILGSSQVEYTNSFTRLFIGETDPISVRERYLSNIVVKKMKQMHLYGSYADITHMYLKRLYNKLFKKDNKSSIDCDMIEVISKFKTDTKKVENFQRNTLNEKRSILSQYVDEEKENLEIMLRRQKNLYMEKNQKNSSDNSRVLSLSPSNIKRNNLKINLSRKHNFHLINNFKVKAFNNNKTKYSSSNNSYNKKIRLLSSSKSDILVNNSYKVGSWFTINNKNENKKKAINDDLRVKNTILKKNNNILMKIKKRFEDKNKKIMQRKKFNLKNYLHKEDFFFTKIN
jgi:hypothetical protein